MHDSMVCRAADWSPWLGCHFFGGRSWRFLNSYRRILVLISTAKLFSDKTHRHHSTLLKGTFASILLKPLQGPHANTTVEGVRVLFCGGLWCFPVNTSGLVRGIFD